MDDESQHEKEQEAAAEVEGDVDLVIQNAAKKANLSVLNVKSILHHVLKDKRVLSVVQHRAAEEEGEGPPLPLDDDIIIEPRLTRSRVREAVASTMSPDKIAKMRAITRSPTKTGSLSAEELLNQSLGTDESSDEEYVPESEGVELSDPDSEEEDLVHLHDNDRDSTLSPMSTNDGNTTTPTPEQATPTPSAVQSTEAIEKETAALLASLSDVILSPLKTRGQSSRQQESEQCTDDIEPVKEGEIAHRTRSKFPLTDTSLSDIESLLQPLDADDPPTPLELDEEDLEWHQWLNDLMNPPESVLGDEGEDTEYNYLAEQDVVEKEELRNDRAVKIPRKEVDELLNELLNPPSDGLSGLLSADGIDPTSAYLLESLGLQTPLLPKGPLENEDETTLTASEETVGCYLSLDQSKQLAEQVRQHFQLLMQTFVLCRFESSLLFLSQVAVQAVDELSAWSQEAEQGTNSAVWYIPDAREGVELIQRLDPNNKQAITMTTNTGNRIPDGVQDIIMATPLFWTHPSLLPAVGFTPVGEGQSSGSSCFTNAEDCLLVMGMDHYGPVAWQQIRANLLPTKTIKQLQLRVKNQSSKRTGANIVKHYKKTKELKIPTSEKPRDLPQWITQYHKKQADKEKEAKKMKEEISKQTAKLKRMLGLIHPSSSRLPSPRLQPKPVTEGGSKRNLINTLEEATNIDKKPRIDAVLITKKPQTVEKEPPRRRLRGRKAKTSKGSYRNLSSQQVLNSPPSTSQHSGLEHLLLAAGLKPSDPSARFAYSYMSEVKRTLPPDGVRFSQFLDVLVSADKNHWRSAKVYEEVGCVLEPWPHLVKLFTELLSKEECVEANAVGEQMEVTNIREFAVKLKEQFKDSPLGLTAVLEQLAALDSSSLTADKVESALLPLVTAHEELVLSLRRFLYQLPSKQEGEWEEVNLNFAPDEFENISNDQIMTAVHRTPPRSVTKATYAPETPKSEAPASQPSPPPVNTPWTRREDGLILKQCLQAVRPMETVFDEVAAGISRTSQEVECRYNELLDLLNSVKKQSN